MVKILVTEDNDAKLNEIVTFLRSKDSGNLEILVATNLVEFSQKLSEDIDICIIDVRIPAYAGAEAEKNGLGIIQHLKISPNPNIKLIAISSFPDEFEDIRSKFERNGCILVNFHEKDVWQNALEILIMQSAANTKKDFLIFTALRKERAPYISFPELDGKAVSSNGITRYDVQIGEKSGSVIELPRMGLVDAAITAGKYIELYSPKLVAMSGICAGFDGKAEMGQLLVSELAYEYQSGKWSDDGFKSEPYQIPVSEGLRSKILHLIEEEGNVSNFEIGWNGNRPSIMSEPKMATFTSGSAVIADAAHMDHVQQFHRNVSGLDMEIYAIHRAAHLSIYKPDVICAKVVVDLADKDKDDRIQEYGCFVSSRFIIKAIDRYFLPNA